MYIVHVPVLKLLLFFFPLFFLKCYSEDTGVSESDKGIYIKKNKKQCASSMNLILAILKEICSDLFLKTDH